MHLENKPQFYYLDIYYILVLQTIFKLFCPKINRIICKIKNNDNKKRI